mmetsp:Transcript_23570/g.57744  ORF Transcript_23570/g.57744 Transcript_23570/m.57744 type:complete len:152 (+) Transcript_23570:134-589(+)|eukprot:CAMPEP_0197582740 /NCGR_PEP_ID=MMETSP1326-20131121/5875_1 /TAXON_ID=1155430 /ORGANISM="Genus nov. species nov., Strain RCC2288" /LENGTH=151 /DNA_ID=CAMNT_0043146867 /DNA_START=63 /DNA_END=518 /DNA_ORIENTATION=+
MAAFVLSMSAAAAPARIAASAGARKVGGVGSLGFRQAISAIRVPVKLARKAESVSLVIVAGKTKKAIGGGVSRGGKIGADGGGKQKTKKSAAKRYKVTASGKVMHRRPGKQHLNQHKSTSLKNSLSGMKQIGRSQLPLIKGVLPYSRAKIR